MHRLTAPCDLATGELPLLAGSTGKLADATAITDSSSEPSSLSGSSGGFHEHAHAVEPRAADGFAEPMGVDGEGPGEIETPRGSSASGLSRDSSGLASSWASTLAAQGAGP